MQFTLLQLDPSSSARRGRLDLAHATVETPAFMPCASIAVVRACDTVDLQAAGAQILCCNAYHLSQRPGEELVEEAGGLHALMDWPGAILTDSGGFQVFSLADARDITEEGVTFRSQVDGGKLLLTPERSIEIQNALGADVAMIFDECPPHSVDRDYALAATDRTLRWAQRSKDAHRNPRQALFGIVQGGVHADLRERSARGTVDIGFDGYALGGLSVGESKRQMLDAIDICAPLLPPESPRYLMGVGTPADIVQAVLRGVDMFDCVLPTRMARHGSLLTSTGVVKIKNACYARDFAPLDAACDCLTCRRWSRAYLHHLFRIGDATAWRLLSIHNLRFYATLMAKIRVAIGEGALRDLAGTVGAWTRRDAQDASA